MCRKWSIILSGLVPSQSHRKVTATLHAVHDSTGSNPHRQPQAYSWLPPDGEEDTLDRLPKSNAASCTDRGLSLHNSSHQKGLEQLARQHMTADPPDTFVSRVPKQNPNTACSSLLLRDQLAWGKIIGWLVTAVHWKKKKMGSCISCDSLKLVKAALKKLHVKVLPRPDGSARMV